MNHNKGLFWILCVLCLMMVVIGCSKREKDDVVARIGDNEVILLSEFRDHFSRGKKKEVVKAAEIDELMDYLQGMCDSRIMKAVAFEKGYDQDSTVLSKLETVRKNLLLRELHKVEVIDKIVKKEDIKNFYNRTAKELVIRNIYFRLSGREKPEREAEVREKALEVLKRIRAGEDYAELAKEYSDDQDSALKGGLLGAFTWTRDNDPIQIAAFSMKEGEVSDTIRNSVGYHIIKLEEIRDRKQEPFEKAKVEIENILKTERKREILDRTKEYQDELFDSKKPNWEEENLDFLSSRFTAIGSTDRDVILDSLDCLYPEEKSKVLIQYDGGKVTVENVMEKIKLVPAGRGIRFQNSEQLRGYIRYFAMIDLLIEIAEEQGLHEIEPITGEMKRQLENTMISIMIKREILDKIQPTEEDIREYYERHKLEKYATQEKVEVQEIYVKDPETAGKVVNLVNSGEDFDHLVEVYSERQGFKNKKGVLGKFQRGRWGKIGEKAFELKSGETSGIISHGTDKGYSVIKLLDREPQQIKPLEKIRSKITGNLKEELKREREEEWLDDQRKKVRVIIDHEVLASAFNESK